MRLAIAFSLLLLVCTTESFTTQNYGFFGHPQGGFLNEQPFHDEPYFHDGGFMPINHHPEDGPGYYDDGPRFDDGPHFEDGPSSLIESYMGAPNHRFDRPRYDNQYHNYNGPPPSHNNHFHRDAPPSMFGESNYLKQSGQREFSSENLSAAREGVTDPQWKNPFQNHNDRGYDNLEQSTRTRGGVTDPQWNNPYGRDDRPPPPSVTAPAWEMPYQPKPAPSKNVPLKQSGWSYDETGRNSMANSDNPNGDSTLRPPVQVNRY